MFVAASLRAIADFLFPLPGHCVICQRPSTPAEMTLCDSCVDYLRRPFDRAKWLCAVCGRPGDHGGPAGGVGICFECTTAPRSFGKVIPGSIYREPVKTLVHNLKYGGRPDLSYALARLMLEALGGRRHDVVVPVPIHLSRLATRQYNQARLLAAEISHVTGVKLVDALQKTRQPASQASLDKISRLTSLAGAFGARAGIERRIHGAKVLLVDDVFTTGATAHFCTLELLRAGARQVDVCVATAAIITASTRGRNWH